MANGFGLRAFEDHPQIQLTFEGHTRPGRSTEDDRDVIVVLSTFDLDQAHSGRARTGVFLSLNERQCIMAMRKSRSGNHPPEGWELVNPKTPLLIQNANYSLSLHEKVSAHQ